MDRRRREDDVESEDGFEGSPRVDDTEAKTPPRFWLVGLVMLGLIVVVIGGAFLLNERFRPRVGIEPAPSVAAPRATARVPAVAIPTVVSPSAALAPTATIAQTSPTVTAIAASTPFTGAIPTADPTQSEALKKEVEQAFQRYLQVYSDAVWNLDASHLQDVLDGQALILVTDEVNQLKSSGRPVKIIEDDRQTAVVRAFNTTATLVDEYTSRSVYADPKTRLLLPRDNPPLRVRQSYEFRKMDGVWKIVDGTREELGEARTP
jgi:hypothetical protein